MDDRDRFTDMTMGLGAQKLSSRDGTNCWRWTHAILTLYGRDLGGCFHSGFIPLCCYVLRFTYDTKI